MTIFQNITWLGTLPAGENHYFNLQPNNYLEIIQINYLWKILPEALKIKSVNYILIFFVMIFK